jgi:lysophospholipase L1-like esterase
MQGGLRMSIQIHDLSNGEIPQHLPQADAAPLPNGIVMFGDSTTAPRPGAVEKVYSQRVAEALQGVASSLTIHNAGVGGGTTKDALARMDRDVLAHQPKFVVIQFGINDSAIDVWMNPPATAPRISLHAFEENLSKMIARTRAAGASPILMTANPLRWTPKLKELYGKPPYDVSRFDGFEIPTLVRYNEIVRKLARELRVPLVDIHKDFQQHDIDKLLLDGMHPNDAGHEVVAQSLVPIIRELAQSTASSKK